MVFFLFYIIYFNEKGDDMKKAVSFSKTITFKTMIAEITDISVKHTLELRNNSEIEGDILVDGKYKRTEASSLEEEFHYKLPFVIAVDDKYNTDDIDITIDDFNFEIINEEDLKINVEIGIDRIYEKELIREEVEEIPVEIDEDIEKVELDEKEPLDKLEQELEKDDKEEKVIENNNLGSIFSNLTSSDETYSTYSVYIVRENDTLDEIINKYKITKEELSDYNDLDSIKIGTKLIIPCHNE